MKTSDFYFELPHELIAQVPIKDRSASKLMILDPKTGKIEHSVFSQITSYFRPGDCLVLNDTRVLPARLYGTKSTGAVVEFLLLKRVEQNQWECLVKPGKKAKVGDSFEFGSEILKGKVIALGTEGSRIVQFDYEGIFEEILDQLGMMPLPPYITEKLEDKERYQTVYSKNLGSAAAPTAGLHFTETLLDNLRDMGVKIAYLTLHVGLGTFRPVKVEDIHKHVMHSEYYELSEGAAQIINSVKENGGRIITVGTTSTRTLESIADENGRVAASSGYTDIFIYPGYTFRIVNGLITNFHLPESTLIMLVSALAGKDHVMHAYHEAVKEKYRFFSFGDAMFILGGI